MSIADFRRNLGTKAKGPGAEWLKADFHVHLPGSSDYEYKAGDALQLMANAIDRAGLAFAVVLKHQEMPTKAELTALQKLCPNTTLIPGAEINVIVDTLFKRVTKDHFFHCIVAVDPEQTRDYSFALESAKAAFTYRDGEYPAGFRSSISDLGRFFADHGALFIPAHLHQGKSAETSRSIDDLYEDDAFLGFVRDRSFSALEVRQLATAKFFSGREFTTDGTAIPRAVCVASSDAHHHDHIRERNRHTWVRCENRNYAELQAALSFDHRVTLGDPATQHAAVVGLHVVGAFIPECWLALSDGLNALIGSKGSGKTAILECLRFVLATAVPSERQEAVRNHLQHILGPAGYVECLVRQADGSELLITRRIDSPSRLTLMLADGTSRDVASQDGPPFPVSILGWHEIEAVADQARARVALLDRVDDPSTVRRLVEQIKTHVDRARDLHPTLQRQIKRLDKALKVLWDLQRKRRTLSKLQQSELSALQNDYQSFLDLEQQLSRIQQAAADTVQTLPKRIQSTIETDVLVPRSDGPAGALLQDLASLSLAVAQYGKQELEAVNALTVGVQAASSVAASIADDLSALFAAFREETYRPRVEALPPEDRDILARQIQVLEETKQLPTAESDVNGLLATVRDLAAQVHVECEAVRECRFRIAAHREALVSKVNGELDNVAVTFLRAANHDAQQRFQSRYGAEGGEILRYVTGFAGSDNYDRLSALFASLRDIDISEGQWKVEDMLWDVRAAELFDIVDDDDIEIQLKVGNAGFVPIQRLSAGQRCVAVFPLLLRDTRGPLIIDQPEDNLDNRYIADSIAPDLLKKKRTQQFLVTSHNANLVVLTDADLIVHVDSDGTRSTLPAVGFLSCGSSAVKQAVLDVLDGGEAALKARQRKYGLVAETW